MTMDLDSFLLSTNAHVILTTRSNIYLEPSWQLTVETLEQGVEYVQS